MATKAAPKKSVAKKDTSKKPEKVTVPATTPKPKQSVKKEPVKKTTAVFTGFIVKATIPVGTYANIMPEISVSAKTLEEARDFAMPYIEQMFEVYAEEPRDGKKFKFRQKANVTVQEKIVTPTPAAPVTPAQPAAAAPVPPAQPNSIATPQATAAAPSAPAKNEAISFTPAGEIKQPVAPAAEPTHFEKDFGQPQQNTIEKSIHYQKAENAVHNSFTMEALDLVQSQITASVKLDGNEKNNLYTLVLKKRAELNGKL